MPRKASKTLDHSAPSEEWANASTSEEKPLQDQSYNFDEGPFAPDYWEDTVLEKGEPEDD